MPDISEGEVQGLADGGFAQVVHDDGTLKRVDLEEIADGLAPAVTAIQPGELGSMAFPHSVNVQPAAAARADLQALLDRVAAMESASG